MSGGGGEQSRSSMLDATETLSDVPAPAPDTRAERTVSIEAPPRSADADADAAAAVPPPPDALQAAAIVATEAPPASAPTAPAAPTEAPAPEPTAQLLRPVTLRTDSHEPRPAGEGESFFLLLRCCFRKFSYCL